MIATAAPAAAVGPLLVGAVILAVAGGAKLFRPRETALALRLSGLPVVARGASRRARRDWRGRRRHVHRRASVLYRSRTVVHGLRRVRHCRSRSRASVVVVRLPGRARFATDRRPCGPRPRVRGGRVLGRRKWAGVPVGFVTAPSGVGRGAGRSRRRGVVALHTFAHDVGSAGSRVTPRACSRSSATTRRVGWRHERAPRRAHRAACWPRAPTGVGSSLALPSRAPPSPSIRFASRSTHDAYALRAGAATRRARPRRRAVTATRVLLHLNAGQYLPAGHVRGWLVEGRRVDLLPGSAVLHRLSHAMHVWQRVASPAASRSATRRAIPCRAAATPTTAPTGSRDASPSATGSVTPRIACPAGSCVES